MTNYKKKLVIGTRSSRLALAQTRLFIDKLLFTGVSAALKTPDILCIKI